MIEVTASGELTSTWTHDLIWHGKPSVITITRQIEGVNLDYLSNDHLEFTGKIIEATESTKQEQC